MSNGNVSYMFSPYNVMTFSRSAVMRCWINRGFIFPNSWDLEILKQFLEQLHHQYLSWDQKLIKVSKCYIMKVHLGFSLVCYILCLCFPNATNIIRHISQQQIKSPCLNESRIFLATVTAIELKMFPLICVLFWIQPLLFGLQSD